MWTKKAVDTKNDVTFKVSVTESFADEFEEMLKYLKNSASTGHSFSIIVDPEAKDKAGKFSMDGDGSDYIHNISRDKSQEGGV